MTFISRWLFSKGDDERAKKISETMAQRNGHLLSPDIWREATQTGATQVLVDTLLSKQVAPLIKMNITLSICIGNKILLHINETYTLK